MADATTRFTNLPRDKVEILLRVSEAAFPIWKRFEDAWEDDLPDHVAEATRAFAAIHDAARAWLETGAVDVAALQAHVDAVDEGAGEAAENSHSTIANQAVPAQVATAITGTLAWVLGQLAGATILGAVAPYADSVPLEDLLDDIQDEPEAESVRDLWRQLVASD